MLSESILDTIYDLSNGRFTLFLPKDDSIHTTSFENNIQVSKIPRKIHQNALCQMCVFMSRIECIPVFTELQVVACHAIPYWLNTSSFEPGYVYTTENLCGDKLRIVRKIGGETNLIASSEQQIVIDSGPYRTSYGLVYIMSGIIPCSETCYNVFQV